MEQFSKPLKQGAQGDPHHEFPLRNGIEKNFKVVTAQGESQGGSQGVAGRIRS
jgi:hypothetical protein